MEVEMRNVKWLIATGLIAATTAGCVESNGYPSTAYNSGYNSGYYSNGTYYGNGASYGNGAYYNRTPRTGPNGDYDRDGIPNKYDRDANGDGVPDRFQR
jgi:hypothetical protein